MNTRRSASKSAAVGWKTNKDKYTVCRMHFYSTVLVGYKTGLPKYPNNKIVINYVTVIVPWTD